MFKTEISIGNLPTGTVYSLFHQDPPGAAIDCSLLLLKASICRVRAVMRGWTHLTFLQASTAELVTLSSFHKQ